MTQIKQMRQNQTNQIKNEQKESKQIRHHQTNQTKSSKIPPRRQKKQNQTNPKNNQYQPMPTTANNYQQLSTKMKISKTISKIQPTYTIRKLCTYVKMLTSINNCNNFHYISAYINNYAKLSDSFF